MIYLIPDPKELVFGLKNSTGNGERTRVIATYLQYKTDCNVK